MRLGLLHPFGTALSSLATAVLVASCATPAKQERIADAAGAITDDANAAATAVLRSRDVVALLAIRDLDRLRSHVDLDGARQALPIDFFGVPGVARLVVDGDRVVAVHCSGGKRGDDVLVEAAVGAAPIPASQVLAGLRQAFPVVEEARLPAVTFFRAVADETEVIVADNHVVRPASSAADGSVVPEQRFIVELTLVSRRPPAERAIALPGVGPDARWGAPATSPPFLGGGFVSAEGTVAGVAPGVVAGRSLRGLRARASGGRLDEVVVEDHGPRGSVCDAAAAAAQELSTRLGAAKTLPTPSWSPQGQPPLCPQDPPDITGYEWRRDGVSAVLQVLAEGEDQGRLSITYKHELFALPSDLTWERLRVLAAKAEQDRPRQEQLRSAREEAKQKALEAARAQAQQNANAKAETQE